MALATSRIRSSVLATCIAGCALAFAPGRASAFAHDWHVTEVYSNADGSVQFIEMGTQSPDEVLLSLASLSEISLGNSVSPGRDLTGSTAGRSLLFATPGFAALPGAVTPDFAIPAGFLDRDGDTLQWSTNLGDPYGGGPMLWNTFSFAAGALPSNGTASLNRALGSADLVVAATSPTNFAGQTGSLVPEPSDVVLVGLALLVLVAARLLKGRHGGGGRYRI